MKGKASYLNSRMLFSSFIIRELNHSVLAINVFHIAKLSIILKR